MLRYLFQTSNTGEVFKWCGASSSSFSSGVLQLCNQPLFTFQAKVNYRFQQAAWRGSGSKQKCLTAWAERCPAAASASSTETRERLSFFNTLLTYTLLFHLTSPALWPFLRYEFPSIIVLLEVSNRMPLRYKHKTFAYQSRLGPECPAVVCCVISQLCTLFSYHWHCDAFHCFPLLLVLSKREDSWNLDMIYTVWTHF